MYILQLNQSSNLINFVHKSDLHLIMKLYSQPFGQIINIFCDRKGVDNFVDYLDSIQ